MKTSPTSPTTNPTTHNPILTTSLYIHIPFCKKKCSYCDFISYAGKEDQIDGYVESLIKEIHCWDLGSKDLGSIYFGGGTPSLLKPKHFEKILKTLTLCPSPSGRGTSELIEDKVREKEITIEANPGTVSYKYLKELRALGINRISIGIQSFNDKHLKILGRIHNSSEAKRAVEDARKAGFENINIDLIFAIPGQTLEGWKEDLQKAVGLGLQHISAYNLILEEGTPFWYSIYPHPIGINQKDAASLPSPTGRGIGSTHQFITRNQGEGLALLSEDLEADMFEYTIDFLKANGYKHYEISNFAKPGFECKHNINYWKMGNWIGIGCAAHSHVDGKIWANVEGIEQYIENSFFCQTTKPNNNTRIKTSTQETIFMGLRLLDGIPTSKFKGFEKQVADLKSQGLIEESGVNIRLTHRGLMLGNLVFEQFV